MNAQPILIHVLLASASVPAGPSTAAASEAAGRGLLWEEIGGQVYARLQPWFDGGWELVPGTLGPHSLRLAPVRRMSRSVGAWLAEAIRVLPYLRRDERPPRAYANDAQFNARALERFQAATPDEVQAWYEQQRADLKQQLIDLPPAAMQLTRLYRWLVGTLVDHYDEHRLPERTDR
jgi:hypothetical protein